MSSGDVKASNKTSTIGSFEEITIFIFSWVVVLPICVALTGKFLAQVFDYKINNADFFSINLLIVKIKAEKDEVMFGFGFYLLTLLINLIFARDYAAAVLNSGAGLNLSKWNATCVFSGLCSSAISILMFAAFIIIPKVFKSRNVISKKKEAEILTRLSSRNSENTAEGGK